MNIQLSSYKQRIAFALALSLLAHALLIWAPQFRFPHFDEPLPEITVKLEPLPVKKQASPPSKNRKKSTQGKQAKTAAPALAELAPAPASAIPQVATLAASAVPAIEPAETPQTALTVAQPATTETPANIESIPFPRHASLIFAVRNGDDGFRVGELMHTLDIDENRYIIQASTRTTGIARWFKSFDLNQTSTGIVTSQGLLPDNFAEEKLNSGVVETATVVFDRNTNTLQFSSGENTSLPENTQDALSVLYQLSLSNLKRETIPVTISTGKKLENYELEVATNKIISTELGEMDTVQLRKIRIPGKPGLRIWLSREFRLLPVKMQYLEPDGTITATLSLSSIRISDN